MLKIIVNLARFIAAPKKMLIVCDCFVMSARCQKKFMHKTAFLTQNSTEQIVFNDIYQKTNRPVSKTSHMKRPNAVKLFTLPRDFPVDGPA